MSAQTENDSTSHGGLMDQVYKHQRLIYDVTRKFYLLGRDHLISEMAPKAGAHILEVACGTGRNLFRINEAHMHRNLYGLDISAEMLISAKKKLRSRAALTEGDACNFDPVALFAQEKFDDIVLSYSLSMIPDWEAAISEALRHLAPGGTLHIVDFGSQSELPDWFKKALRGWLSKFHVTPRDTLEDVLTQESTKIGAELTYQPLYKTYAQYAKIKLA